MKRFVLFATMSLALSVAVSAMAAGDLSYQMTDGNHGMLYGGSDMAKASRDTIWFWAATANSLVGKFQDASGNANWQGWTHQDITYTGVQHWNIDNFNVPAGGGTLAMWCGQRDYPNACDDGYGNNFNENLVFTYTVANPNINTTVNLQCIFNSDSEPGFDYLRIQYNVAAPGRTSWDRTTPSESASS